MEDFSDKFSGLKEMSGPDYLVPFFPADHAVNWTLMEDSGLLSSRMELFQSWMEPGPKRADAGHSSIGWTKNGLIVAAELSDKDVFNPVTGFNEMAFKSGDVVEVFVVPKDSRNYYEIHAAPSGSVLQLKFDRSWKERSVNRNDLMELIEGPRTSVDIQLTKLGWRVLFDIPWTLLEQEPRAGEIWRISICRYDYTRGEAEPVLSSTSLLPRPDFHLLEHYNFIRFEGR